MTNKVPLAVKLFYSSVSEDESFRRELDAYLKPLVRQNIISTWHESQIPPGYDKRLNIDREFSTAQIVVLFISPAFLNSEQCYQQMEQALAYSVEGTRKVVPVLIRNALISATPLKGLQLLPANGKAMNAWSRRDDAWEEIAGQIEQIAMALLNSSAPQADGSQATDITVSGTFASIAQPDRQNEKLSTSTPLERDEISLTVPPPAFFLQHLKMPAFTERFLEFSDRDYLINVLEIVIDPLPSATIKNLLRGKLPPDLIGRIKFRDAATRDIAEQIMEFLEPRGSLNPPTSHALGAFFRDLLENYPGVIGYDGAVKIVALLFRYTLLTDREQVARLSARYQIPSPLLTREALLAHPLSATTTQPQMSRKNILEEFESLYNYHRYILDVKFLLQGAAVSRAVCRIDFDKVAEGTGFLVAPNLVLTNYHVMYPRGFKGDLQERAGQCEIRFGVIDGISVGTPCSLHKVNWRLEASEPDDLDFMLLQLDKPVTDNGLITPLVVGSRSVEKGAFVNIIHHPRPGMEVSLRFNSVTEVHEKSIYYLADTEKGSSGAPVFNDAWQIVALHRSGGIKDKAGNLIVAANIGIPIKPIREQIWKYLPK